MIRLVDFNDHWKNFFSKEKNMLLDALRGQKVLGVEHIGATSVVLCKTCGTIDLLCIIPSKIEFITIKNLLVSKGYQYLQSMSNDECYTFARRNDKNQIVSITRVIEQASVFHKEVVLFKGYLRESDRNVRDYNNFRKALLENCGGDAKEYQKVKQNYIRSILHDFCEVK